MSHKCNKCDGDLILDVNWTDASKNKNLYTCSECRCEYQRKWHSENRERQNSLSKERYKNNKAVILKAQRVKYLKDTFDLSIEEYEDYIKNSDCKVCGKKEDLVLDHCHTTGKIRGVLCRHCNMAIGLLGDNLEGVRKAMEYLDENN